MHNKYNIKYCIKDAEGNIKRIYFNSDNKKWFCLLPDTMEVERMHFNSNNKRGICLPPDSMKVFYMGRTGDVLIILFEDEDLFESKNDINIFDSIYNLDSIKDKILSTVEELCNNVIIPETICFEI